MCEIERTNIETVKILLKKNENEILLADCSLFYVIVIL